MFHISISKWFGWIIYKRIKLVAWPLLLNCSFPSSCWDHTILHVGSINSILTEIKYFQIRRKIEGSILTIVGRDALIVGSGQATTILLVITHALLYLDSTRTLLYYRDILKNGIHVEIYDENNEEFLLFSELTGHDKHICKKISTLDSGLYYTYIKSVNHVIYKVICQNVDLFQILHYWLGHRRIRMIRKNTSNSRSWVE